MEYVLDDNVVIPEDIKKMSREELKAAIKAAEAEIELRKTGLAGRQLEQAKKTPR